MVHPSTSTQVFSDEVRAYISLCWTSGYFGQVRSLVNKERSTLAKALSRVSAALTICAKSDFERRC